MKRMTTITLKKIKYDVPFDASIKAPPSTGPEMLPTLKNIPAIKLPAGRLKRGVMSVMYVIPSEYIEPKNAPASANNTMYIGNDDSTNSSSINTEPPSSSKILTNIGLPILSPSAPIGIWNRMAPKLNAGKIHVMSAYS